MGRPVAVYVHTPFCPTKCGYCDFNSFAGMEGLRERTSRAIAAEIARGFAKGRPAKTIFFGGGTPTYLSARQIERILAAVLDAHPPLDGCEITSEANPGTVDIPKFDAMRRMGFNRISLGAQSFCDSDLKRLGRVHAAGDIESAVRAARRAGFENVNLDLMFALPGQTLEAWRENLERAIALQPEHLSLYCLTLEPNTPFYREHLRGRLVQPDEEAQVAMYDLAVEVAEAHGYRQYEISNFARPGFECMHNLAYWRCEEYAGYGPGAVGCLQLAEGRLRYTNLKHPSRYCERVESGGELWCDWEELDEEKSRLERIMLGLRMNEGLSSSMAALDEAAVGDLRDRGWLDSSNGWVRLTSEGRHWCSEAALRLA